MRVAAAVATAWAVYRWVGLAAGLVRLRRFEGLTRREARRTCVARTAWNVAWSVLPFLLWLQALGLRPRPNTIGIAGGALMISLVAGIAAAFMQPEERDPSTFTMFSLRPRQREAEDAATSPGA